MSKDHQDSAQPPRKQNDDIVGNPGDGLRTSARVGSDGKPVPAERSTEEDERDQSAIEMFGQAGAGIAAKE